MIEILQCLIRLRSSNFGYIFEINNLNPRDYSHWIFDIQGAEYMALKGAKKILKYCKSLEIEISKNSITKVAQIGMK